jgi:hypothetical protein
MTRMLKEIKDDLSFIKSHTLQPQWYKVLKVFILIGFLAGYFYLFGLAKTTIFLVVFLFLSLIVHLIYRQRTKKYTRSWLDFMVVKTAAGIQAKSIGKFYYFAIILNTLISIFVSQMIAG